MGTLQRKVAAGHKWARVQNESTEQTVFTGVCVLVRIIVTGNGAAAVVTVSDGAAATAANILNVLETATDESRTFEFGTTMANGIRITPVAIADITIIYDG